MTNTFKNRVAAALRATAAATVIGVAATAGVAGAAVSLAGPATAAPAPEVDTGMVYGDPAAAAKFWREQHYDDCALMSVADVVGQLTGHMPTEQEIIDVAEKTPSKTHPGSVYIKPDNPSDATDGMGTSPEDEVVLLAHYGITGVITDSDTAGQSGVATGLEALEKYLAAGRRVIAGVNAETIWNSSDGQRTEADHALVVTGVDTKRGIVHLNDSGTPDGRDEQVSIATFMQAWKPDGFRMIVTERTGK
ncbi:MAG: C39 family peptidase [Mycobacteriaceae bacterium]|nr:C39 family peptidase [Mycobacteriaceae bacterium]